jgi:hypothetical protein
VCHVLLLWYFLLPLPDSFLHRCSDNIQQLLSQWFQFTLLKHSSSVCDSSNILCGYSMTLIVTCMCGYRWGFGLVNVFIDHLYTWLRTTSNYNATAISTAPTKPSSSCCLAVVSNSGDSSASHAQVFSSQPPVQNYWQVTLSLAYNILSQTTQKTVSLFLHY